MRHIALLLAAAVTLGLAACAVPPPTGPSVMALPGPGKSFEAFQQDEINCRNFAWQQTGGVPPGVAASQSAVGSAALGTALGAAAGAAIGAASGAAGVGAAIGAGAGLLAGSAAGANNAAAAYGSVQQLYDISYTQCMVAQGNSVQPPPVNYAAYPYPAYPYPYFGGYYGPSFGVVAPSVSIGIGTGWGWGGDWGWRRGWAGPGYGWGWRGGYGYRRWN